MRRNRIKKSVEVEISETLYADVTLGLEEIVEFINECNSEERAEILVLLNPAEQGVKGIKISTLEDVQKMETLIELFNKHTSVELEQFLNN